MSVIVKGISIWSFLSNLLFIGIDSEIQNEGGGVGRWEGNKNEM